tara:strand:- start:150 stop:464 length:315 start_codon:yes stop_codon:yes gene_type:complete
MFDYFFVFIILLVVYFWFETSAKREIAVSYGKNIAKQFNLQLLDDTVYCNKISIVRTSDNWPSIKRVYFFSVSASNDDRLHCQLTISGKTLTDWYVPPYPQREI